MKKLILITSMLTLTACGITPQERQTKVMEQVELAQTQKHGFCEGSKLFSYMETDTYYMWTCSDGRNFMLPKD
jgi:hypothetical protein